MGPLYVLIRSRNEHAGTVQLAAIVCLIIIGGGVCSRAALAESVDAQRVEERLPESRRPTGDSPSATNVPPVQVDENDLGSIPEFILHSAQIEGVSAIRMGPARECAAILIGEMVGAADLVQLTECITGLYRAQGFFLSRAIIPRQEVRDGVLFIQVVEGYIESIDAAGMNGDDARSQFAATLAEPPARLKTFERDLLLLADRNGYQVASSQLLPDPQDMARYTFKVKVVIKPVAWRIYGDNRGSGSNGSDQAYGSLAFNSLAVNGDRLASSLFTSPSAVDELLFADIAYTRPWFEGALWTEAGASVSNTKQLGDSQADSTYGESERFFARATAPILRTRAESLWATILLDGRETSQIEADGKLSEERVRVLRGSFSYTLVEGATRSNITIELSHGVDAFGASRNGDALLTRADGRPQFTKVKLEAALNHTFSKEWDISLFMAGQHADGGLVGIEEFGAGGARFGRAYDYSEITGDDGAAIAIELRYSLANAGGWLKSLQFYAFADGAMTWNRASDPYCAPEADLSSAGIGIRATPFPGVTAGLELARPLSHEVARNGDRDLRPFVTLQLGW